MKKILALLMSLVLLAVGGAAFAQAPESFGVTLSDPYFEMTSVYAPGEKTTYDLAGLAVELTGTTAQEALGGALTLLVDDIPAAQMLYASESTDVLTVALVGMTQALQMPLQTMLDSGMMIGEAPAPIRNFDAIEQLNKFAEGLEIVDAGTEVAEFYGGGKLEANKQTFTITEEQFSELMNMLSGGAYPPDTRLSVDAVVWEDASEIHIRGEIMYHITVDDETLDMPLVMQIYAPDEDTMYMKLDMDMQQEGTMHCDMMVTPSADVAGYVNVFFELTAADTASEQRIAFVGWPSVADDGVTEYTASFTVEEDANTLFTLGAQARMGEADSSFKLTMDGDGTKLTLGYDGTIAENVCDGVLSFTMADDSSTTAGRLGVRLLKDNDVAMPDLSEYTVVDVSNMTEEQSQQLMMEAQTVAMQALGALMQVPGLQDIILSMM